MTDEAHTNMKLREDDELRKLVPRATDSERTEIERSIRVEGLRERIVVWRPPGEETEPPVILDGHTRHGICRKHDVDYDATKLEFGSRKEAKTWILITQLGRRNLTTAGRCEVAASLEPLLREPFKTLTRDN